MGIREYRLDLRRSMRETLSNIFYRMYYYNVFMSGGTSITGKITVQVGAERDARSFWWGGRVVGFTWLTKLNYKPGRCIKTLLFWS